MRRLASSCRQYLVVQTLVAFLCSLPTVIGFQCTQRVGSCICGPSGTSPPFRLVCPSFLDAKLEILIKPGSYVDISCTSDISHKDMLEQFAGLELGSLAKVMMVNCPVPEDSFVSLLELMGVTGVKSFSFSKGSGGSIQPFHLQNFDSLLRLDLNHNDISDIDKTFFEGVPHLTYLDLTGNQQLHFHDNVFQNLSGLRELILNDCGLVQMEEALLRPLTALERLSLQGNLISELPANLFQSQANLTQLSLRNNQLRSLPQGIFDPLPAARIIDIGHNQFKSLPEGLFAKNANLSSYSLVVNGEICSGDPADCHPELKLKLAGGVFRNSSLESIKFLHAPLVTLPPDLLQGLTSLKNFTVQNSHVLEIPAQLFQETPQIEIIDFAANKIKVLPENVFANLSMLRSLRLFRNQITELDNTVFLSLIELRNLELQENLISRVASNAFAACKELVDLNLAHNSIVYDGQTREDGMPKNDFFGAQPFSALERLNLSYNVISELDDQLQYTFLNLTSLDLSYNSFKAFNYDQFIKSRRVLVNISFNHIETFMFHASPWVDEDSKTAEASTSLELKVEGNPLLCDCFAMELKEEMSRGEKVIINSPSSVKCGPSSPPHLVNRSLADVNYEELSCPFPSKRLDVECPYRCFCSWIKFTNQIVVNCTGRGLTSLPHPLPSIPSHPHSSIPGIILHLEQNKIQELPLNWGTEIGNNSVTELYLSNNSLTRLSNWSLASLPPGLRILALDGNRLREVGVEALDVLDARINSDLRLKLGANPYECSCASKDLYKYVKLWGSLLYDSEQVWADCSHSRVILAVGNLEEFCQNQSVTIIVVLVVLFLVLVILGLVLYNWHKETLLIWVYAKPWARVLFPEDLMDSEKPYDAFISYSHHDATYVNQVLLTGLENPDDPADKYKCLVHERDWQVGEMIPDQIVSSVQNSRRTIIVLSKEYIKSIWTKLEFRAAHAQALEDRTQRVILIVCGDLPEKSEMEEDLQKYISLNTYLDRDDPWFWQKLRYSMPHRGGLWGGGRARLRTRRETDRIQLMRGQAELELAQTRTPSPLTPDTASEFPFKTITAKDSLKLLLPPKPAVVEVAAHSLANGHMKNGYVNAILMCPSDLGEGEEEDDHLHEEGDGLKGHLHEEEHGGMEEFGPNGKLDEYCPA